MNIFYEIYYEKERMGQNVQTLT